MADKSWLSRINPLKALTNNAEKELATKLEVAVDELREQLDLEVKFVESESSTSFTSGQVNLAGIDQVVDARILETLYCTEAWVYIAINAIAKTIAGLPQKLEKKQEITKPVMNDITGQMESVQQAYWIDASGDRLFKLFESPNSYATKTEFEMLLTIDLLAAGEYYVYLDSDSDLSLREVPTIENPNSPIGRLREVMGATTPVKAMYRLPPALVKAIPKEEGGGIEGYVIQSPDGVFGFACAEIIHVKLPNPLDPYHGLSPLIPVFKSVLLDRYATENMVRFYKSGARLGGVVETEKNLTKEQLSRFQRSFENNYTGKNNHHRTLILPGGMKYREIQENPATTALLDFEKNNRDTILSAYGVPPIKVGIMDGANYANARVQLQTFFRDTIMPILEFIENGYNTKKSLMPPGNGFRIKHDLSHIDVLQDDLEQMAKTASEMAKSGLTVNEIRKKVWKSQPIMGGDKSPLIEEMQKPSPIPGQGLAAPAPQATKIETPAAVIPELSSLTGPQVSAMMDIVTRVTEKKLAAEAAVELLKAAFGMPDDTARQIVKNLSPGEPQAKEAATQPDAAAIAGDVNPTNVTFNERVEQLTSQYVAQGNPIGMAVRMALEQATAEGLTEPPPPSGGPATPKSPLADNVQAELEKLGDAPVTAELIQQVTSSVQDAVKPTDSGLPQEVQSIQTTAKAEHVQHWKSFIGTTLPMIDIRLAVVQKFFKDYEQIVQKRFKVKAKSLQLPTAKRKDLNDDDAADILDPDAFKALLDKYVKDIDDTLAEAAKFGYADTLVTFKFEPQADSVKKMLQEYAAAKITGISDTTRDQIKAVISDAVEENQSVTEISQRIAEKFDEISIGRATVIARTEVLTAVSEGREMKRDDWKQEFPGKKLTKTWVSAQDNHVRDSHADLDGQTVNEDEEFLPNLKYPRDPDCDDASEVINCRCTDITSIGDDTGDNGDGKSFKGGPGSGRHPGGGSPKPTPTAAPAKPADPKPAPAPFAPEAGLTIDNHTVSNDVQIGFDTYRDGIKDVLLKAVAQRNQGITRTRLTKEDRAQLKKSIAQLEMTKAQFMHENGIDTKQTGVLNVITKDWVANSDSNNALVFRQVVAELTGGNFNNEYTNGSKISTLEKSKVEYHRAFLERRAGGADKLKEAVQAEVAFNQAMYHMDNGNEGRTLFRGGKMSVSATADGTTASIKAGAASSWSTSPQIATNFALSSASGTGTVLSKQVKPEDILVYYKASPAMMKTGLGLGEGEVVVKSDKNQISNVKVNKVERKKSVEQADESIDISDTDYEKFIRADGAVDDLTQE